MFSNKSMLLVLSLMQCGCDHLDRITNTTSPPPAVSVNELAILGVTLTASDGRVLPSLAEVNPRIEISPRGEEYVAFDNITLFFSPAESQLFISSVFEESIRSSRFFPYQFIFVSRTNEGVREVVQGNEIPSIDFTNIDYVGSINFDEAVDEFIVSGNHYLRGVISGIPTRATNLELWYRATEESQPDLITEVALEQLIGWQDYVSPLIQ